MMRLLAAESARVLARRMTWIVLIVGACFLAFVTYAAYNHAQPLSAEQQRQAQSSYEEAQAEWEKNGAEMTQSCREHSENPAMCDDMAPRREWFGKPEATLGSVWDQFHASAGFFYALLALLMGATLVGAEFSSGALSTWLTFEPRRTRVFLSKLLAPLAWTSAAAAVLVATMVGLSFLIVAQVGGSTQLSAAQRSDLLGDAGRLIGFLLLCTAGGIAAAFLLRHTAAVLALVIGYGVVEQIVVQFIGDKARWSVFNSVLAALTGEHEFTWFRCGQGASAQYTCEPISETISAGHGFLVLSAVTVTVLLASWWAFRRRDLA